MTGEIPNEAAGFTWRDLEAADVYYIAHLENNFRTQIGQIAINGTPKEVDQIPDLVTAHRERLASWLTDQAAMRGRVAVQANYGQPEEPGFDAWLDERMRETGLSYRSISSLSGAVSASYLHTLRAGGGKPSRFKVLRIAQDLASYQGLTGEERDTFVQNALHHAKFL